TVEDLRPIIIFQTDGDEIPMLKGPDYNNLVKPYLGYPKNHIKERTFSFDDVQVALERSHVTLYNVIPGIRFVGLTGQALEDAAITFNEQIFTSMGLHYDKRNTAFNN